MTIKVDKEAILQLVRPAARILMGSDKSNYISKRSQEVFLSKSSSSAVPIEFGDDGALLPHSAIDSTISYPEILPPDLTDTDDDCESMSSGSTDSCHSDTSSKASKRVSFAWPIVTEVRSRPLTLPEDVATLFYSAEETQRFRHQYRLERLNSRSNNNSYAVESMKSHNESSPSGYEHTGNRQDLITTSTTTVTTPTQNRFRQCIISRVVVMHNNIRDIFVHADSAYVNPCLNQDNDHSVKVVQSSDHHFFDNDSFWNGSLTWFDHSSTTGNKR